MVVEDHTSITRPMVPAPSHMHDCTPAYFPQLVHPQDATHTAFPDIVRVLVDVSGQAKVTDLYHIVL